jgi:type I restriction enzyme S subunit
MIKLKKDNWETVKLDNLFIIERGGSPRPIDDYFTEGADGVNWIKIGDTTDIKKYVYSTKQKIKPAGVKNSRMVYEGDFILSNSMSFGRPYIMKTSGCIHDGWLLLREKKDNIDKEYLYIVLSSELVFLQFKSFAAGTTVKNLNIDVVKKVQIPLPSLQEQRIIASLFQSMEASIEEVEKQEKELLKLQNLLIKGLLNHEPIFGDLLDASNCTKTDLGFIADCDKTYPEHSQRVDRFIGLENIESGDFRLNGWGKIANGTTFTKRFTKGDILFGKRRAYLKKIAVADFDGICSGDIIVIRAKQGQFLQGLLPFYLSSDAFIEHAVRTSAGSLSPRTKWKDLAQFELSIPDLKAQNTILVVLNQIQVCIRQLRQQQVVLKDLKRKLLNEILG